MRNYSSGGGSPHVRDVLINLSDDVFKAYVSIMYRELRRHQSNIMKQGVTALVGRRGGFRSWRQEMISD